MKPEMILKVTAVVCALASLAMSVSLYFAAGDDVLGRLNGIYVGIWVPSILSLATLILAGKSREEK